jgi:predicted RNA-binding Zn-ribbon protein involved in translation (DUF1610 family)
MKKVKTYKVAVNCSNCGVHSDVNIKLGIQVNDKTKLGPKCPNCGCVTLARSPNLYRTTSTVYPLVSPFYGGGGNGSIS